MSLLRMLMFNKKISFGQVFLICMNSIIEASVIELHWFFFLSTKIAKEAKNCHRKNYVIC